MRRVITNFISESWPFLFNRLLELAVDFSAMLLLSKVDPERESAASLITSMSIVLRSVNACFLYSTMRAVRTSISNPDEPDSAVGNILHKAWLFAFFPLGLSAAVIAAFASEPIFLKTGQPSTSASIAKNFFVAYSPGLLFILPAIANQQTVLGLSRPKTVLLMTSLTMPWVILLGYPLIFGLWGFPELKETGLGLAYSMSFFMQYLAYFPLFKYDRNLRRYGFFDFSQLFAKDGVFTQLATEGFWIGFYALNRVGKCLGQHFINWEFRATGSISSTAFFTIFFYFSQFHFQYRTYTL